MESVELLQVRNKVKKRIELFCSKSTQHLCGVMNEKNTLIHISWSFNRSLLLQNHTTTQTTRNNPLCLLQIVSTVCQFFNATGENGDKKYKIVIHYDLFHTGKLK
jgi:hypothetical protein